MKTQFNFNQKKGKFQYTSFEFGPMYYNRNASSMMIQRIGKFANAKTIFISPNYNQSESHNF